MGADFDYAAELSLDLPAVKREFGEV